MGKDAFKRNPDQIWTILDHQGAYNPDGRSDPAYMGVFNWTMSHSKLSTVYRPWFYVKRKPEPSENYFIYNDVNSKNSIFALKLGI